MCYEEKWNVGYRYLATANVPALYPFGYGLSYTDFRYSNMQVTQNGETVSVFVDVENVGAMDGKEVVQLYVSPHNSKLDRPVQELKAFQKVFIKAGEQKTVVLHLDKDAFTYYDEQTHSWQAEQGEASLQICKNANMVLLQQQIQKNG